MTLTQGSTFITPLRLSVDSVHILFTILSTLLELHSYKNTIDNARMVPSTMNIPNVYVHAINFVLAVLQLSVLTWLLQKYTIGVKWPGLTGSPPVFKSKPSYTQFTLEPPSFWYGPCRFSELR